LSKPVIQVVDNESIKQNGDSFTITDANGKTFEATLDEIINTSTVLSNDSTDTNIADSIKNMQNFTTVITDSVGVAITDSELIDCVKSGEAVALDVTFEATHSGENLNHAVYTSDSMENDASTWLFPFAKPLIKNHYMDNEPLGRAVATRFGPSEFDSNRDCIDVTYRVSDEDAMVKFADGRYKTMSIGASSSSIKCNICGKAILKDNKVTFCGHWKGNVYADKKATWTVEGMTYKEGSVVNNPADVYAQVKRIRVIKKKEEAGMKDSNDASILNDIDGLLGKDNAPTTDPVPEGTPAPEPTPNVGDDNKGGEGQATDNEPDVNAELETAKSTITDLEAKVAELTATNESLTTELNSANDSLAVATTDNEGLKAESEGLKADVIKVKDQAKRLAEFNLKLLKDNLVTLNPELTDEALESKTAKEVHDMIQELKTQKREPAQVGSPGLAVKDNNDLPSEDDDKPESQKPELTMKDMEHVMINIFEGKH
jgi:hypothetical protein